MTQAQRNHIGGEWIAAEDAEPNVNPSDVSDVIGDFAMADADQVGDAVAAAREAAAGWAATLPGDRFAILDRAGEEMLRRSQELGDLLAREEGKPLVEAVAEVERSAAILKFHAGQVLRDAGEHLSSVRPGVEVTVTREPVGVVAAITPWNFPMAIPAWKLAPALAYGNTVVFKPAELVPGCAWELTDILVRAGLPDGVLNLVMGQGDAIGDVLTGSPDVDAVSFTGSVATGKRVLRNATEHHARVQLEMGGKNPLVIADDADLDVAVEVTISGSFGSAGQRCTASSRVLVMSGVYGEFLERLEDRLTRYVVDDARRSGIDMGPLVDERQLARVEGYLEHAREDGGQVRGGERLSRDHDGHYLSPALVLECGNDALINREEVFGPVAGLIPVDSYEEAVHLANDTDFGLSAGIVTTSLARAADFRRRAVAGLVTVNLPTAGVDYHVPFGGRKASSYGPREQGTYAREFYTLVKTAYVKAALS